VLKAMAKHPGNRYQTAVELRQDLERFLAGRGVLATPLLDEQDAWSPGGPAGAAARTGTGGVAGAAAGGAAGAAAGGAAGAAAGGAAGAAAGGAPGPGSDAAATSVLAASRSRPGGSRRRPRRAVPAWAGWAGWIAAVLLLAVPVAFFMVRSIGGTGAPARTTLAPLAVDPGVDPVEPVEPVAPTTTRLATTTNVPSTTTPATTPTTAPATTAGTGPALVRVPGVVGLRAAKANAVLTEAGFTVRRVDVPVRQRSRAGRVLSQTPGAGAQAPAGSQVVIAVGTLL